MADARATPRLRIELTVSKRFIGLASAGHLGAFAIGMVLALSTPWLASMCAAVVVSWLWTLRRHALLRSPRSFIALELEGERSCTLQMRRGDCVHGELQPTSYVLPWLIILHVAVEDRMRGARVVLFADSMAHDSHRRLRVRLRWTRFHEDAIDRSDPPL